MSFKLYDGHSDLSPTFIACQVDLAITELALTKFCQSSLRRAEDAVKP